MPTDLHRVGIEQAFEVGAERETVAYDRAETGGDKTCEVIVTSDDGARARASAKIHVMVPKLESSVIGPPEALIGKKTTYTVRVKNAGELPLENVMLTYVVPDGFRLTTTDANPVVQATYSEPVLGALQPGESKDVSVCLRPTRTGTATFNATVTASRDTKAVADCRTVVEGIPAMRMEVADLDDPVEKGGETTYEIRVTNTGSKADENVMVACDLPPQLEYVWASGPVKPITKPGGARVGRVEFEPLAELAPKTEAVYRLKVKAVEAGDVRVKAVLTSKYLTAPVSKEESTRVYGD
jgi:uncharacterized repeat protein (TIGR01451 family)